MKAMHPSAGAANSAFSGSYSIPITERSALHLNPSQTSTQTHQPDINQARLCCLKSPPVSISTPLRANMLLFLLSEHTCRQTKLLAFKCSHIHFQSPKNRVPPESIHSP
jgi:hypothetical protein